MGKGKKTYSNSMAPNVKRRKGRVIVRRSPVAKHAGINKAVTHPDQSKTIPRFRKHKLHEAMFDDQ